MANDYFNFTNPLARNTNARAEAVNAYLQSIESGFALLPAVSNLNLDTTKFAQDTGTANAIVVAMPQTMTAYVGGSSIRVKIANTNTGPCTINVDGLGVRSIKLLDGSDPAAGDIVAGDYHEFTFDSTNNYWVMTTFNRSYLVNASASASAAAASASAAATSETNAATSEANAATSETNAASSASSASSSATLAQLWANQTTGVVASAEYSAKAYAIGGTGVTGAAGAAKEWAITISGTVDGTNYSAKEYAIGTQVGTGGSAKNWAQEASGVTGAGANDRSAKSWAQEALLGATLGGSSKDWAQYTAGTVDGTGYSAKYHANAASSSASNAATSETNAAASASNAATSETNAAASATAASTSETNAATSETNAANSATAAAASETNAAASATSAANSAAAAAASAASVITAYNMIINGDMSVAQRATSQAATSAGGYFTVDRWKWNNGTAGTYAFDQVSDAPAGFDKSLKITVSTADTSIAAGDYASLMYNVEGYDAVRLGWGAAGAKSATISFWVKCSITGTFPVAFENSVSTLAWVGSYTVNAANTWEYKTITVSGETTGAWDKTNGKGVIIHFTAAAGTTYQLSAPSTAWATGDYMGFTGMTQLVSTAGATFQITGVQFEVGTSASDFEYRPYSETLAACQRYYFHEAVRQYGYALDASNAFRRATIHLPQAMRTTPTVSWTATTSGTWATYVPGLDVASPTLVAIALDTGLSSEWGRLDTFTADAEL